jgi:hypothetical protein
MTTDPVLIIDKLFRHKEGNMAEEIIIYGKED